MEKQYQNNKGLFTLFAFIIIVLAVLAIGTYVFGDVTTFDINCSSISSLNVPYMINGTSGIDMGCGVAGIIPVISMSSIVQEPPLY